ncbi:DUF3089 domain-containing protein [Litorimonas sp. WD9-15]|uniref:DUF3089 domain-containing protein n=1 Tax=Litorimonas sp. WD9-15 TaxID=3418716 RepID=UPI003D047317
MSKSRNFERLLRVMAALLGIAFVLLIIAYLYRDDIFQSIQDPGQPFQTYEPPIAPVYTEAESWLARPDLGEDPYTLEAKGDVFVAVPSVYRGGEHWNLPWQDRKRNKMKKIVRPNYVSPYGQAGRLFAPNYRQASLYAFMTNREDAQQAQDFAYQDIKRAFEYFLENSPPERPIVLVGHNQGASHVQRLLMDFFQGDLRDRLAVAYVIDHPLPLEFFKGPMSNLLPCETPEQTGCVVAFGSFTSKDKVIAERFSERLLVHNGQDYEAIANRPTLCTNPLLWTSSEDYAPPRLHLGGVAAEGLDPDMDPAPMTKQSGAQCQGGLLLVDIPRSKSLRRPLKVGGKFRTLPSNLFYEDLKQDAKRRVEARLKSGDLPERAGAMLDDFEMEVVEDAPVTIPD